METDVNVVEFFDIIDKSTDQMAGVLSLTSDSNGITKNQVDGIFWLLRDEVRKIKAANEGLQQAFK